MEARRVQKVRQVAQPTGFVFKAKQELNRWIESADTEWASGFNVSLNGAIALLHPDAIELDFKQRVAFRYHSDAVDLDEKLTARDGDTAAGD